MEDGTLPSLTSLALAALRESTGLEGAAVIEMALPESAAVLLIDASYDAAPAAPEAIGSAYQMLRRRPGKPSYSVGSDRRPILVSPLILHPDRPGGLALWRAAGAAAWSERDADFATSAAALIQVVLKHGPGDAWIDRLTGLPNRFYFLDTVNRHIERLKQDGASGTMLLINMHGSRRANQRRGFVPSDNLLIRAANLLRAIARPVDTVARVGGDEFAVWFDNVDHMTAAERAIVFLERDLTLSSDAADVEPHEALDREMTVSVGIASRESGDREDARALLHRARQALWNAQRAGGGGWAVSHVPRVPRSPRSS
jgi:diguanylate cyclase (GGDEF)-like protein